MPKHDLVIIGAGPGGYVAAIRAAQLGLDVACIDKEPQLGGTCLRVGCIPSKALLESSEHYFHAANTLKDHGVLADNVRFDLGKMLARKDRVVSTLTKGVQALFKKNKVTRYLGHARFTGPNTIDVEGDEPTQLTAKNIIIATGSKTAPLPNVVLDGHYVTTSTEALSYPTVPNRLVVIGAGYIGLELGSVWSRLGAKVLVLEYLDRILPGMDTQTASIAQKTFEKQGIEFRLGVKVTGAAMVNGVCIVDCHDGEAIECDKVLLAAGRIPNTEELGLEAINIKTDDHGRISVDRNFATSVPNVYAIGDVIRGPMLAHKAEEEGVACVEQIVNGNCKVNYDTIPGVVYTDPEIASVGKTEEQLHQNGTAYRKGVFAFRANGRARAIGDIDGQVKILADETTDRILGVHIIGPRAGDLIAEATVAMEFHASSEDLARSFHAHPTLAEAIKEAALNVAGRAIHA